LIQEFPSSETESQRPPDPQGRVVSWTVGFEVLPPARPDISIRLADVLLALTARAYADRAKAAAASSKSDLGQPS
jgi:hypothetical protein